jgi:putative ABC transport system permease protein
MIGNYLLTAVRNCVTHKLFTFINVGGLAVGLTCAVFIMLFVRDELSYDRWIPDSKDLYRVEVSFKFPGRGPLVMSGSTFPLPSAMADQFPEVKSMTHLVPEEVTVSIGDRAFAERVDVVDPQFFQVIKLPLVEGNAANVLAQPDSAVISQSIAKKYFGSEAGLLGKTLIISGSACTQISPTCEIHTRPVVITGILRDLPHNTQLAADIVVPNTSHADLLTAQAKADWTSVGGSGYGYVLLAPGADPGHVLAEIKALIDRSVRGMPGAGDGRASAWLVPQLTRFWDAHLTTDRYGSMTPPGDQTTVYGFAVIGILILLVACFNFTNLAIARATLRAREISLRKVMGARRSQIVVQFLGEAVLMAMASLLLTLAVIEPLRPEFDRFLDKPIAFQYLNDWPLTLGILLVAIVAGLLSGLYPAVVLSNIKPAVTLRSNTATVTSSGRFRAVLVILQFAVSIGLGIAAFVVFAQISYARHVYLGFRTDGIVIIDRADGLSRSSREGFANALRTHPGIVEVAVGTDIPIRSGSIGFNSLVYMQGVSSGEQLRILPIGPQFTSVYDIRLLAGRYLSDAHGEDVFSSSPGSSFNALINTSAARRFGFTPEQAIGKTVIVLGPPVLGHRAMIVGVIDDMKMGGARQLPTGTIYFYVPQNMSTLSVRVRPEHLSDTLSFIDKTWSAFAPGFAIRRYFLSDEFNKQFEADARQGAVFVLFVAIAIFIACLGLFGLAAFTAERRTKEIGIRKTFGAKARHIVLLLLWQFSIPVLLANLIAWPLAYYYLRGWLEGYAERISLNPLYFLGAGAVALLIAWATVYAHAYRMARANPIDALRHE